MSSPAGLRARRDSLASVSASSQADKAQLAQALDKIHTSASQSDALTTFNDFAHPPGSAPPAEVKGTAGDLVQQGLSGLYTRLKEAVGVGGKGPAQEPDQPVDGPDGAGTSSKKSTGAPNHTAKNSVVSFTRGESGGTASSYNTGVSSDAQYTTMSSSGAMTADTHSQPMQSSKASMTTMATTATSKSASSSGQTLPKIAKAVTSSVANPTLAPITVSAFKDKDASRGITTRVEDGPLSARARSASKTSEGPVPTPPATTNSFDSGDLRIAFPIISRRDDGQSVAGSSETAHSPVKGSAASVQSADTSLRASGQSLAIPSRENLRKPAVIDRISRSRLPGGSRSRSSSLEPGMAEPSPIITSAHNSVHHDSFAQQNKHQQLASGQMRIPGTTTNEGAPHAVNARLEAMRKQVVSKEFWMADETCKECFLCGQAFSAFRRKHHCRTCGCIFDSKCTSTISGQKFGVAGTLRVCKTCLDIINRRYDSGSDDSGDDSYLPAFFRSGVGARGSQNLSRPRADDESSIFERGEDGDNSRSVTTPMMAIPATRRIGDSKILEIDAPQLSRPSSSRSLKSLVGRPISSGHRRNHSKNFFMGRFKSNAAEERAPFRKAIDNELGRNSKLPAFHDDNIIDPELEPYMSDESSGDEQMSIFATMSSNDLGASNMDQEKPNFGSFLSAGKRHRMRQGEKSISGLSFTSRNVEDGVGASSIISHTRPARRRNMSTASIGPHHALRSPRPKSGVFGGGFPSFGGASGLYDFPTVEATKLTRSASIKDERPAEVQLSPSSLRHVKKLLRQLLQDNQIPSVAAWEKALLPILLRCADDVSPNVREADLMDIRNYVKVKKIPGSKPGDTSYVSGLIFTKNLALKSMPRSIVSPRIVIVSFPIEYQRHQQQFMSLQPVIEQEKEFLRVVVQRIIALRPQVLLAEKSVAGVALQYLSEANIAVAYNVKPSVIWAVARCVKASVISSLDMLALPAQVGQAGGFEVKTFVNKQIPGRKKTYIFVSGCERELGCTIALRGASKEVLAVLKRITDFMVYVVYNLKLESCLMRDEFIRLPEAGEDTASLSLPSTSKEPTDESLLSMSVSLETSNAREPSVTATTGDKPGGGGAEDSNKIAQAPEAVQPQAEAIPGNGDASKKQDSSAVGPESQGPPPSTEQEPSTQPVSLHDSHSHSPVPEDVPMPTFYSDMVTKYETKLLSASPFVKFSQPYLLMKAREQERRLVYLRRLRDQNIIDEPGESEKTAPEKFQLIKPEMVHELGQKAPRQIMEVLHAVHDAEYDKALYNYKTQARQWENYIQGNSDLFDPLSHQSIVVLHSLICTETTIPCSGPEIVGFYFYEQDPSLASMDSDIKPDRPLGRFIEDYCVGAFSPCEASGCERPMWQHHRTFVHEDARLTFFIEAEAAVPNGVVLGRNDDDIYMWNYCKACKKDLGVMVMSESAWKYSFGKYLELAFWGKGLQLHEASHCPHDHQTDHIRYFNFQGTSVRIHYDPIDLLEIIVPRGRITWKVDHDLRLKNDIFTKTEERWKRFMASVCARLKSIRIDSVLPEKTESCRAEVERLTKRAQEDQPELVRRLQAAYMNSKYYEVVPMNPIIREMLEHVAEWDAAFAKFEADFLSDKDVRQLTMIQLRKMFGDNESKESLQSTTDGTSILTDSGTDDKTTALTTQTSVSEDYSEKAASQPSDVLDASRGSVGGTGPPSVVIDEQATTGAGGADTCDPAQDQVPTPLPATVEHLDLATSRPSASSKQGSSDPAPTDAVDGPESLPTASAAPSGPDDPPQPPQMQPPPAKTAPLPQHDPPCPPSPPPLKSHPSLTEKVEQIRREFRTLSGETNQLAAAVDSHSDTRRPPYVPERGSSRRSGLNVSPPMVRAITQPSGTFSRTQSGLGKHVAARADGVKAIDSGAGPDLARTHQADGGSGKSDKKLSERLGLSALKPHRKSGQSSIPRFVHGKKKDSRVSTLAKHFEQLSREFEKERVRDRKQRAAKMHYSRAFLPRSLTKATVEVYKDVAQLQEQGHEDDQMMDRDQTDTPAAVTTEESAVTESPIVTSQDSYETHDAQQPPETDVSDIAVPEPAGVDGTAAAAPGDERPSQPDETLTETEGEGGDSRIDESRVGSEDEGASDADQSSVLEDILHIPETMEPSDDIPKFQKSSLMKMLTNFWAERSASSWPQLDYPLNATDHIFIDSDVIVREDEPSSLIAFALSSTDYQAKLADIRRSWKKSSASPREPSRPETPRDVGEEEENQQVYEHQDDVAAGAGTGDASLNASVTEHRDGADDDTDIGVEDDEDPCVAPNPDADDDGAGIEAPVKEKKVRLREPAVPASLSETSAPGAYDDDFQTQAELERSLLRSTGTHLKYQFTEGKARMLCKIFYAEQFDALRRKCGVADRVVESLSRCLKWNSRGGKTRSVFLKTLDDRLVIKSLSSIETSAFLEFAPDYFNLMAQALFHELPSVIAKMLGFFQVVIKNPVTNTDIKLDLLVMENLFYDRNPQPIFDLKGSMRNRKIQSTGEQNEVLLDENMVEYIYESPLFAREHSKKILHLSVWNDTLFLMRQNVMDYSLMVGVDEAKKELVVGIVDCIRTYTWDKKLEGWIKGGRLRPTVITPKDYKSRFRAAMERYILQAPNCWHQFGTPSGYYPILSSMTPAGPYSGMARFEDLQNQRHGLLEDEDVAGGVQQNYTAGGKNVGGGGGGGGGPAAE